MACTRYLGVAVFALALIPHAAPSAEAIVGHAEIVDGDTIRFGATRVRINGIDAPEAGQTCASASGGSWECGAEATRRLSELVGTASVRCEALDRDGYGRTIARCWNGATDLAEAMVRDGLAWAYREYSMDYAALEDDVKSKGVGIWQAQTAPPWRYRNETWGEAANASPRPGCPIKGNISSNGRIYHTPWSRAYSRTKIDERKGERWFCDEAEALAAGWTAPKWQ